ncbi:Thiol-disulfide isomerase-like thioredoxin OS=Singulisphaera acidiphila (strain ATCC BAA-1392 / DSM 18658 / VKM B-2454 / MOB10) GN=Sinac_5031 PE=4 SV=1: Thioredoxin_8 [Gemmataceae bacterium]|nr:Thiol-disulfide isomerase-like thioredoxin OS=Singulisphaera acidiphila (strain ATCC BAA-1392 / DSM 18658 / VKM B-2454 / MOB10) GN=Sinac_5031 PE=4 SV=1: Thioredoxin_8 [Gemmataceae bacterium]VTU01747.1 Thiol-disulfide isomerase-like thioredoxin OS=Singulisphaera acidiphila (strain ATCC BAA-1392 / DSM 18658 / VKM B-2454 / MOB10) GN=Sinac_5031 PE=4 SV=1: Thioredoxin_8 [Gemmataceae bacterium]
MGRHSAGLIAAVLALAGCKSTADPKPSDREPVGALNSRAKDKGKDAGKGPAWLDPVSRLPGTNTSVPKGGSWTDPNAANFDAKAEAQDGVGGKVVDVFNRPAKNIFIRVEGVNDAPGGGAKGIYADNNGYFFTRGLKPGSVYNLTAEATQDGRQLTGTVQVRVPNPVLTIVLRDDLGPPGGPKSNDKPVEGFPPPPVPADGDRIPSAGVGPLSPARPGDGAYSPGAGATGPVPSSLGTPPPQPKPPVPGTGGLPEPDELTPTGGRPARPENVADGPRSPFAPPSASIPGPPVPQLPPAPSAPFADPKPVKNGRGVSFRLIDTMERNWDFPTNRSGSVVLVEFVTTACPNCKPAVPVLKDLQSKYGAAGLQVVAVLCDDVPVKDRVAAAARYAKANNTNYPLFVEPGAHSGAVRDLLGVESYPRGVLLNSSGAVLWEGHPGAKADLEAAVRKALGK